MEKKEYSIPKCVVEQLMEDNYLMAGSTKNRPPESLVLSDDDDDVINDGFVSAKPIHNPNLWDGV